MTGYTDLQSEILGLMHRPNLTAEVVGFIARGESRINSDLNSRMAEQEIAMVGVIGSRYIDLPVGYMANIDLWMDTYPPRRELFFTTPENLPVKNDIGNGRPLYYTIDGSRIGFDIPCDIAYDFTFRYKGRYDLASTGDNDINTNYPGVYLYAALIEGAVWTHNNDKLQVWSQMYQEALALCQKAELANTTQATLITEIVPRRAANILSGE